MNVTLYGWLASARPCPSYAEMPTGRRHQHGVERAAAQHNDVWDAVIKPRVHGARGRQGGGAFWEFCTSSVNEWRAGFGRFSSMGQDAQLCLEGEGEGVGYPDADLGNCSGHHQEEEEYKTEEGHLENSDFHRVLYWS